MKRVLTSGGSLSVWQDCVRETIRELNITEQPTDKPYEFFGRHDQYGLVRIKLNALETEKVSLEIWYQDEIFFTHFKKSLAHQFKTLSAAAVQQAESPANEESGNQAPSEEEAPEIIPTSGDEAITEHGEGTDSVTEPSEVMLEKTSEDGEQTDNTDSTGKDQAPSTETSDRDESEKEPSDDESIAIKICKECGAEMDRKALLCPQCGAKQINLPLVIGVVVGFIFLVIIGIVGVKGNKHQTSSPSSTSAVTDSQETETPSAISDADLPEEEGVVTLEYYKKIEKGMKYEAVCGIFGREGILFDKKTAQDENNVDAEYAGYYWEGQGGENASVTIYFKNGVVEEKLQYGLQ